MPPSIRITPTTAIKILPDRICPRLPMVYLNKNKDLKKYRSQATLPTPFYFKPTFGLQKSPEVDLGFLWQISEKREVEEKDTKTFWEKHILDCEQQASTSGLSDEEKEEIVTVPGQSFKCFRPIYMVDDILGLPLRTPASTIFSSQSYVSESPPNNLGKPYPWDTIFGYQRDPIP